jgi:glycerol uptake facilitator-like aquaporin
MQTLSMQKLLSELIGTATLALVVVGSGAMAENLTNDVGVQLLINAAATGAALWLLITLFAPISGAHFNPVVSGISFFRKGLSLSAATVFLLAQTLGAITGTIVANILFQNPAIDISSKNRDGGHLLLSEVIATAGLIFVIFQLSTIRKGRYVAVGVASWIFAAYFFTSSTSFANPAIAIGRTFSDTFAGIAPHSAATFIPFQIIGGALGYILFQGLNKKVKK